MNEQLSTTLRRLVVKTAKGIPERRAARIIGIDVMTLRKILRGGTFSITTADKLASHFGLALYEETTNE